MVLWYYSKHDYKFTFETATLAFFNKYPNPYASHVLSVDVLDRRITDGKLHTTRLIKKEGKLPRFMKPFLGKMSMSSWIVEKTIVDPHTKEMVTYQSNLDHKKFIRVEEYTTFKSNPENSTTTVAFSVKFSSNFAGFGIKNKIESWSHNKFKENIKNTKLGMAYVMEECQRRTHEQLKC